MKKNTKINLGLGYLGFYLFFFLFSPFAILPVSAAVPIPVSFNPATSTRINPLTAGLNENWMVSPRIQNQAVTQAFQQLNLQLIRFPGGTVSDFYDWDTFRPNWDRAEARWGTTAPQKLANHRDSFELYTQQLDPISFTNSLPPGITVVYSLNVLYNTPNQLKIGLNKMKQAGIRAQYFELGNEPYYFENKDYYFNKAKAAATVVKQIYPDAKIGITLFTKGIHWQVPNEDWFDAIVGHLYIPTSETYGPNDLPPFIATAEQYLKQSLDFRSAHFPNKSIWITEWSISDRNEDDEPADEKEMNTFAHTYFTYSYLQKIAATPKIELANYHSMGQGVFGGGGFSIVTVNPAIRNKYENTFIPDNQYTFSEFYWRNAPFYPLSWYGKAVTHNNRVIFQEILKNRRSIAYVSYYYHDQPSLNTRPAIAIVNRTSQSQTFSFNQLTNNSSWQGEFLAYPFTTKSLKGNELTPVKTAVTLSAVTIPPYGLAYLETTGTPAIQSADLNSDGTVNLLDYNLLKTGFGTAYNLLDYNTLRSQWGQ